MTISPLLSACADRSVAATRDAHPVRGVLVAFGGLLLAACQFLKSEIRDNETRQREALLEVKGELKSLGDKLDRFVESLLASKF